VGKKPDFEAMDMTQLLDSYNATAEVKRRSAWPTKVKAIERAEAEWMRANALRKGRAAWKIEVKSDNPHRAGTQAHIFYEAIKQSPTIGDFMSRYQTDHDKQAARIYLRDHALKDRIALYK